MEESLINALKLATSCELEIGTTPLPLKNIESTRPPKNLKKLVRKRSYIQFSFGQHNRFVNVLLEIIKNATVFNGPLTTRVVFYPTIT